MVPKVAVVLVNYNGKAYLQECLEAVYRQEYSDFCVVLANNASTDSSTEGLTTQYPDLQMILNSDNLGFSAANDIAIQYAVNRRAEYVLLLNTDTVIDAGMIAELVKFADVETVTAPRMYPYDMNVTQHLWYNGGVFDFKNQLIDQTFFEYENTSSAFIDAQRSELYYGLLHVDS